MKTYKRKEFYLSTDVWTSGISCRSKTVLAFLSYCANREGKCFPSIARIAKECAVSPNTVRRALAELKEKGLLSIETRIVKSVSGCRQTSNLYILHTARGSPVPTFRKEEEISPPETEERGSAGSPEPKMAGASEPPSQSKEDELAETKLMDLLERLDLAGLYEEKHMGKALELAIRELWYSDGFRFKGERIPKERVRERLLELDVDAVDTAIDSIAAYEKSDPSAYMKACLYDAPLRSNALTASQIAEYRRMHG